MKNRLRKRRISALLQGRNIRTTAEEQAWLDMAPVGYEFGSKDYERLARLDALADKARASARRASASIDETLSIVAESNLRIEAMAKLDEIHLGEILLKEFIEPSGITPEQLAASIGLPYDRMHALVQGSQPVTEDIALGLGQFFKMRSSFWINLQADYDRRCARRS